MKALILVDIQKDFLPGGSLAVPAGDEVILVANTLLSDEGNRFDLVIATQDWHPQNHQSFASQHPTQKVGNIIDLHGMQQVLWPDHCIQGSTGAKFADSLAIHKINHIVRKGTDVEIDSYSGFFDNGKRKSTGLAEYLSNNAVKDVYILGLATDYCVKFTALDSVSLGFNTFLIEDGCRGVNLSPNDVANSIVEMKTAGVSILNSSGVMT